MGRVPPGGCRSCSRRPTRGSGPPIRTCSWCSTRSIKPRTTGTFLFEHVEGLLQVALEFRAYRRIRAKVFLRTDQFADRIGRFPDASKIMASKVDLRWLTIELYGLLWQLLANHQGQGADFALVFQKVVNQQGLDESLDSPVSGPCLRRRSSTPRCKRRSFTR